MITCDLCGRQFKNTQGLRGHKTFYHGQHTKQNKQVELNNNRLNVSESKLDSINNEIANVKINLGYLQNRFGSLPSTTEIHIISSEVKRLKEQVKKHEEWLNPNDIDDVIFVFNGGPIASIEKRLNEHIKKNK